MVRIHKEHHHYPYTSCMSNVYACRQSWEHVTLSMFCKYPNPFCSHVLTSDIIDRHVDPTTGRLYTKRVFEKTSRIVPPWISALFKSKKAYIVEESVVDPQQGVMQVHTTNLSHRRLLNMEEHNHITRGALESGTVTETTQSVKCNSRRLWGVAGKVEAFGASKFAENLARSRQALFDRMEAYVNKVNECAEWIINWTDNQPIELAIVCGSGLGEAIARLLEDGSKCVPYLDIPHFPVSTVVGHAGRLLFGRIDGRSCLIMQGRLHYYEGHDMQDVVLPIRAIAKMGIQSLILTNACGSINLDINTGDIVMIQDHIAFPCMTGITPLRGENYPQGERFPGMTHLWSQVNIEGDLEGTVKPACYGFISGPQFETPAEVRALRLLGVDVVGMSTVPEAIAAKHAKMRTIIGVGLVTNECIDCATTKPHEPTHQEVLLNSTISGERFARVILHIVKSVV